MPNPNGRSDTSTILLQSPRRWWTDVAFVLLCIGFSAVPVLKSLNPNAHSKGYDHWFEYGQKVIHGEDLYPEDPEAYCPYLYPPTSAIFLFAPLSLLGRAMFTIALVVGNSIAWYLAFQLSLRLFSRPGVHQPRIVVVLPFLATLPFVCDTFFLGQINVVLLLLMLVMFACLRADRPWLAGGALAMATAIKAFPLSALVYLVWRRQWHAAIATVVWLFVILVVLPAPFRGFDRNAHELALWYRDMLADQSGTSVGQRPDVAFTYRNQSLLGVEHRLTRPVIAGDRHGKSFYVNVLDLAPEQSQVIAYCLLGALGLVYVAVMPRRAQQSDGTRRFEWAMLLILMVVSSPLAQTYFYCWMMPAWIAIVDFTVDPERDRSERRQVCWTLGLVGLVMATALTQPVDCTMQAIGVTFWGGIGLFFILVWLLRREDRPAEPPIPIARTAPFGL